MISPASGDPFSPWPEPALPGNTAESQAGCDVVKERTVSGAAQELDQDDGPPSPPAASGRPLALTKTCLKSSHYR